MNILQKLWLYSLIICISVATGWSQNKRPIALEDIFSNATFYQRSVRGIRWMPDGPFYTALGTTEEGNQQLLKYNLTTGQAEQTLVDGAKLTLPGSDEPVPFEGYSLSADQSKVLLSVGKERIYRRSNKANYYVYDREEEKLIPLSDQGKQSYATFSPDGKAVAYVRENNLYLFDLASQTTKVVTENGSMNQLIHGSADWVYEEEFSFAKAFFWSPEGDKIAFYTFDESEVRTYNMQRWSDLYPSDYVFKYPKAGEDNSVVSISVYHLDNSTTTKMDLGENTNIYIPRIQWTTDNDMLSIIRMCRYQNKLEILHGDVTSGSTKSILTEKSKTYVDIDYNDQLIYFKDGKHFIRTSEKDGFKHIYLHRTDGSEVRQITKGNWEVTNLSKFDEASKRLYFTSTEASPLQRQLYSVDLKGRKKKRLTREAGYHNANFSTDGKYFIDTYSSNNQPLQTKLHRADGSLVKPLQENRALRDRVSGYNFGQKEFFQFDTKDGVILNGYMIKPADFDPNKTYPVLMFVYGGPGSQLVTDRWMSSREIWFHYLAQKGYIIACVDNRGTGGRGRDFKHITYLNLGKYEVADQIEAAKYLGTLSYTDASRIGIWGWSYGGYMSSLALLLGADHFKMAISVAPVTSWRFYDTIYTERYMRTPRLNPEGYDDYSPVNHVEKLKGDLLLIHGTGDDNVHFQNSVVFQDALIAAGKQFDSFYYPNRNHGIYGGNTSLHLFKMMTNFIDQTLGGGLVQ
ncbi:MAG: S9 family peptidase [Cyclobacteriaceae bacterium]